MLNNRSPRLGRRGVAPPAFVWRRVQPPKPWTPFEPGDQIEGLFGGTKTLAGRFGAYQVGLLFDKEGRPRKVSGAVLMGTLESVREGERILIRYLGKKVTRRGYTIRDYEVFRAETLAPNPETE